jgi:hypothetical protein
MPHVAAHVRARLFERSLRLSGDFRLTWVLWQIQDELEPSEEPLAVQTGPASSAQSDGPGRASSGRADA